MRAEWGGGGSRPYGYQIGEAVTGGCGAAVLGRVRLLPSDWLHCLHTTLRLSLSSPPPSEAGWIWSTSGERGSRLISHT